MNFPPTKGTYGVMSHEVATSDPVVPGPPGEPLVEPLSTKSHAFGGYRSRYTASQPPVDGFQVEAGSFRVVHVQAADCLAYDVIETTKKGNVVSEEKSFQSLVSCELT